MNEIHESRSPLLNRFKHLIHIDRLPHMGQRIVKTAAAVFLCLMIYYLRGYQGMVSQSTVTAIICTQSYHNDILDSSIKRMQGTTIGAFWGLLFLLMLKFSPHLVAYMPLVYLAMAVGVALTLYFCVVFRQLDAAGLAAIVFLCIVVSYPDIEQPLTQTIDRVADTVIGILVTLGLDTIHLPRKKHPEYIFYVRLQDMVQDRFTTVSSAILVMLNRLSSEGANICLISKWAPAFLLSQMGLVRLRLPVIVMDGAAIYDIENGTYIDIAPLPPEKVKILCKTLEDMGLCYQIYSVQERSMLIYRRGHMSWAEERDYNLIKASPYRNYLDSELSGNEQVTFIRFIDSVVKIGELEAEVCRRLPEGMFRVVRRDQPRIQGYCGLYFYDTEATVEKRKETIAKIAEERRRSRVAKDCPITPTVSYDVTPLREDYLPQRDAMTLLTRVRYVYSPVDVKQLLGLRRRGGRKSSNFDK